MVSKNADFKNNKNKKKNNQSKDSVADKIHREGGRKIIADPRFSSLHSDPRFQNVPKRKSKVPIDSRFASMFTDKNFAAGSAPSDKRGKPKKHKPENSLRHFYSVGEDDEDASEEAGMEKKVVGDEEESEDEVEEESDREELGRLDSESAGSESTSKVEASESDDTETTTDEEDEEVIYEDDLHEVQVENIPTIEDGTRRLAAVNMDWRHVRAVDLYVVLRSFLPKGGEILSVAVYPSEFGLQQMKEEEIHGPVGLFDGENKNNRNDNSDDDDDDDEIDDEKLRAYEKSRMRYYYAVVECNSVATAEHLYKACDGVEFERSSNVLDLRFIPDSMEFKHPPRDVATEAPGSYEGLDFHTKALQHSNIPISWDEDEPQRAKTLQRKFNADQLADLELKEFLASDESESDEDENENENDEGAADESDKKLKKRDKYRALIVSGDGSNGEDEEETQDMEITFNTGLEGLSKRILEKRDKKAETVWEEHLRKQREKKKARKKKSKHSSDDESSGDDKEIVEEPGDFFIEEPSTKKAKHDSRGKNDKEEKQLHGKDEKAEASRAELELLLADDDGLDNGLKGYNLKHKKSKGKKGKEVPDENKIPAADYADPRFSALFTSSLFALDPTDPQFKRSATYARQMVQKQQKGDLHEVEGEHKKPPTKSQLLSHEPDVGKNELMDSDVSSARREKYEISSLVKSIKMKSNQVKLPSNGKSKNDEKLLQRDAKDMDKPELSSLVKSVKKKAKVIKK